MRFAKKHMISAMVRKCIHPILLSLIKRQRKHQLHILNSHPPINGNTIYAINHSCKYDMPYASEIIKRHAYVLAGKQRLDLVDRAAFFLNGVIYVDRKSKCGKAEAKKKMKYIVSRGLNLCVYPEGTWNLTPSRPLLPLYWGIIDVARETGCPIIPLVLEYRAGDCYAQFGEPVCVALGDQKKDKIEELAEKMATLKWNIWEMFPAVSRKELEKTEWEQEKRRRLAEYPKLDYEYEASIILKNVPMKME